MRWITHQTGAVLGALALAMPVAGVLGAGIGATIGGKRSRQKIFNRIHRGASHWFGWWVCIFICSLTLPWPRLAQEIVCGIGFGSLSHIALDLLTPAGVPLLPFSRKGKLSLPVCVTGKAGEYVFLFAMLCAAACYWSDLTIAALGHLR